MRSTWDPAVDAAYIDFSGDNDEPARRQVLAHAEVDKYEVILDIAPSGKLLGVEILGAADALDPAFLATLDRLDPGP